MKELDVSEYIPELKLLKAKGIIVVSLPFGIYFTVSPLTTCSDNQRKLDSPNRLPVPDTAPPKDNMSVLSLTENLIDVSVFLKSRESFRVRVDPPEITFINASEPHCVLVRAVLNESLNNPKPPPEMLINGTVLKVLKSDPAGYKL